SGHSPVPADAEDAKGGPQGPPRSRKQREAGTADGIRPAVPETSRRSRQGGGKNTETDAALTSWLLGNRLQKPLLLFFLADRAMAGPGNRFKALLLQLGLAIHTGAESVVPDAIERSVNLLQRSAVRIILAEQELLGVGVGGLVR